MQPRALGACLILTAWSAAAAAAPDYDPGSTAWNGLSELGAVAAGSGLTLEASRSIAWTDLGPADVLFVLYPTATIDAVHMATFIRAGGRALIADDYGRADEALARLGILRHPRSATPPRSHDGNPNLPIAVPVMPAHRLARGVAELVTNHPSTFTVGAGPDVVFGLGRKDTVVVAGALGGGRFVALSDPSVLINDMLAFDGNLAFAADLLDFLAPGRPARVVLVTGDVRITGVPRDAPEDSEPPTLNEALARLGGDLEELNDYLAPEAVLRTMAVVGGLGVLLVSAVILPLRRGRDPDGSFARVPAEPASVERLVAEYDDDVADRNYAYPAAVLRENVERELEARVAGLPAVARGATLRALDLVRRLPARAEVLAATAHVTRRAFFQAYDAAMGVRRAA